MRLSNILRSASVAACLVAGALTVSAQSEDATLERFFQAYLDKKGQ